MQVANQKYRNYVGIESTKREITFGDLSKLLKDKGYNQILRGLIFFTAYANGHDDNKFITYDFDLGGTPFGGTVYSGITYGERRKFFNESFGCRTTSNGVSVPYAVFSNFDKSVDFISTYYSNPINGKKLYNSDPEYKWNTKDLFIESLVLLWIEWWPTKSFQTTQQRNNWILANAQSVQTIRKQASESVEKCISLGLITF